MAALSFDGSDRSGDAIAGSARLVSSCSVATSARNGAVASLSASASLQAMFGPLPPGPVVETITNTTNNVTTTVVTMSGPKMLALTSPSGAINATCQSALTIQLPASVTNATVAVDSTSDTVAVSTSTSGGVDTHVFVLPFCAVNSRLVSFPYPMCVPCDEGQQSRGGRARICEDCGGVTCLNGPTSFAYNGTDLSHLLHNGAVIDVAVTAVAFPNGVSRTSRGRFTIIDVTPPEVGNASVGDSLPYRSGSIDAYHPAYGTSRVAPNASQSVVDIDYQSNGQSVACSFVEPQDHESGVVASSYRICWTSSASRGLSDTPPCDLVPWISLAPGYTFANASLSLRVGQTVHCVVSATNNAGLTAYVYSNGVTYGTYDSLLPLRVLLGDVPVVQARSHPHLFCCCYRWVCECSDGRTSDGRCD